MIAAGLPIQRPPDARLLAVGRSGRLEHWRRADFVGLFRPGDLVVANDAATMPASLSGRHLPSGEHIEVRLAGRASLFEVTRFSAVLFGRGDYRTPTEHRPAPPPVRPGDRLQLGPLGATIVGLHHHPRLVALEFEGTPGAIWEGLARHGRPIQYSHLQTPLALWDTWTSIAGPPVAFEPPSAGFLLDWNALAAMAKRQVRFATITHAAGISSTGDAALDALLPLDEPYRIPPATASAIRLARERGSRIIAVGTTVVRALEHAGSMARVVPSGERLATQRIDRSSTLRVVSAVLSGTHEPGTSHYDLLGAFADPRTLVRIDNALEAGGYRTHEFGDSIFLERAAAAELAPEASPRLCDDLPRGSLVQLGKSPVPGGSEDRL
jgi:S-adenosylmethionine:tRNA ribosyltransferase-isomerase